MSKTVQLSYCQNCETWQGTNESCKSCGQVCAKKDVPCRRAGLYFINGVTEPLPSVTSIINVLAKPALTYWLKQKVAEAVFTDPSISMQEALAAPDNVRDKAAAKGSSVHAVLEAAGNGMQIVIENYSTPWKEYIEAYQKFCKDVPHSTLFAEQIVHSKKLRYAGQLDTILKTATGNYLVDFKTSKGVYPKDTALQLSAYREAVLEMKLIDKIDGMAILHLKPDSTYSFIQVSDALPQFLSCLNLYNYQKND